MSAWRLRSKLGLPSMGNLSGDSEGVVQEMLDQMSLGACVLSVSSNTFDLWEPRTHFECHQFAAVEELFNGICYHWQPVCIGKGFTVITRDEAIKFATNKKFEFVQTTMGSRRKEGWLVAAKQEHQLSQAAVLSSNLGS